MPWLVTNPMDERVRFIVALDGGLYSVAELSQRFGVSRQCGDTWRRRYLAVATKSHAPHCPHKSGTAVTGAVIQLRRKHPNWGPVTLLARLGRLRPELQLPAPSTVGRFRDLEDEDIPDCAGALASRDGSSRRRPRGR
jgi:putative transposase